MKPFKVRECFNLVSRGKSPQYVEQSDVKVVNQACIYWEGLNLNKVKYQDESKNYDKGLICSGDVLVNSTGTGTLGRAAVVPHVAETEKLIADSHVTILRPNTDIINPYYFTYYLQDSRNQERLYSQCVNGSTNQIELSKEKLSELMITLPKIDEQGIIVDKLRKIDEVRNKRQKQLEKLDELVKARFVEMFGDILSDNKLPLVQLKELQT